jgi:transaldolase
MNPLLAIHEAGQSIWLDFITRQFMADGKLAKLIAGDGLSGVTSNPTIFQKAISGGHEYDETISVLVRQGKSSADIFDALSIEDIQKACDAFREVYDRTRGADGFVSLEVNPHFARDTKRTTQEASRLFKAVSRPNVMIKIPATKEGLPSIAQALGEGININITLIFALKRYEEVMDAWLTGLEQLDKSGKPLKSVSSVASFFVSRVDSLVDGKLEKLKTPESEALSGKAAIANAQLAYDLFLKMKASARFQALAKKGARVQRPLWASTSTKNPKYRDVIYVEELIGNETVNTLPLATVDAVRDHANVKPALPADAKAAAQVVDDLFQQGISMDQVTQELEIQGLKLFADSYDELMKSLDQKREALKASSRP